MSTEPDAGRLWTYADIAAEAGVSISHAKKLRQAGLPEPVGRARHSLLWDPTAIRQWAAKRRRELEAPTMWSRTDIERHLRRTWAQLRQLPSWPDFPQRARGGWERDAVLAWWRDHQHRADGRWDSQEVAIQLGLSWNTVRTYRKNGVLPEPDGIDAGKPWWWPDTIEDWDQARRRDRGGRPREHKTRSRKHP